MPLNSYRSRGWRILEVHGIDPDLTCTCGRQDCRSPGKHPTAHNWAASASPTTEIRPGYNVGLATGQGLIALDFDGSEGKQTLAILESTIPELAGAWRQTTGSGGTHLLFSIAHPVQNRVRLLPGMDIRGDGGMIVVAPSQHYSGGVYTVTHNPDTIPPLPQKIEEILGGAVPDGLQIEISLPEIRDWATNRKARKGIWKKVISGEPWATEGERDNLLFVLAGDLARGFPAGSPTSLARIFETSMRTMGFPCDAEDKIRRQIHALQQTARDNELSHPYIPIGVDDAATIRAATVALARVSTDLGIYVRAERLSYVSHPDPLLLLPIRGQAPQEIRAIPQSVVGTHLSAVATWTVGHGAEVKHTIPPPRIVKAFAEHGFWPEVSPVEGISYGPVLRSDGSVWSGQGYDPQTGLFGVEGWEYSHTSNQEALEIILPFFSEFPWASPEAFASWIALVLSVIGRYAYSGPAPMFLLDANTPGCGKTLLAVMASYIATGRGPSRGSGMGQDPEEDRKKVTTLARQGARIVLIDNVKGLWGTSILEEAMTVPDCVWSDRLLGGNETYSGPLQAVWVVTANNVRLRGDMHRRTCYCRLEGPEDPSSRVFHIRGVDEVVRKERRKLYNAFLSLLVNWARTPRDIKSLRPWGSYESWSAWVRGAVIHAGLADPADARVEMSTENDSVHDLVLGVAEVIKAVGGKATPGQIANAVWSASAIIGGQYELARNALVEVHPRNRDPQTSMDVRRTLEMYRGRIASGISLQPRTRTSREWVVR